MLVKSLEDILDLLAYVGDILIFSQSKEAHKQHLQTLFLLIEYGTVGRPLNLYHDSTGHRLVS